MFRFNTSVYSTVGTEYELNTQFSLHPYFQHAAVVSKHCFEFPSTINNKQTKAV